jgi:hypothetical protein
MIRCGNFAVIERNQISVSDQAFLPFFGNIPRRRIRMPQLAAASIAPHCFTKVNTRKGCHTGNRSPPERLRYLFVRYHGVQSSSVAHSNRLRRITCSLDAEFDAFFSSVQLRRVKPIRHSRTLCSRRSITKATYDLAANGLIQRYD